MPEARHVWSLVLAGGDGNRLRALTTKPCGTSVPKQYCSLHGGHSLLEDAIARARRLMAPDRVCIIVAQQHREWWTDCQWLLEALDYGNLIDLVDRGLTQPVESAVLDAAVPGHLRDPGGNWYALSMRARVIYVSKERVSGADVPEPDVVTGQG